jgi:hypothetical protein
VDLTIPLAGLHRASENLDSAASRIARETVPSDEPPSDVIELSPAMIAMLEARNDYVANLRSAEAMDETSRTLTDLFGVSKDR